MTAPVPRPGPWSLARLINLYSGTAQNLRQITFNGGVKNDWFTESTGIEAIVHGGDGSDTPSGGGNDAIYGGDYHDGQDGRDELFGFAGNDAMRGGAGDDHLDGQNGNDGLFDR